ncbi:hypothetical protein C8A01DRAFT_44229 [Parachaetomium inaequale]|uniref:DUF7136 domain-containing protein n=1 Tax=Parachaetomium inaequale TaxID=2588326 RepID=A0AAN6PMG4_9PEZI|nr:hypothetical protein C8A01DRAFT_44229 [Parachaetomium inaequale]
MHLVSRPFLLLGWGLTGLLAWSANVQAASGTVEVDLVLPQNDTYAPAPIIPVAFAIQRSDLAAYLQPSLTFSILPYNNWSHSLANGHYAMTWANFTSSDPYMQYGEALEVLNTEGVWMLIWQLDFAHCSAGTGVLNITGDHKLGRVVFTTKNGAKKPDLTAATTASSGEDTSSCPNDQAFAFNITETRDSGDFFENRQPCAVLAETTPAPSPCAVTIDTAAASSVSSSLTHLACRLQTGEPAPWCPEPEKDAAAGGVVVPRMAAVGGVACLAAAVGGLGFLAVV